MPSGIRGFKMALAVVLWLVLTAVLSGYDRIGLNLLIAIHVIHGVLLLGFCHSVVTHPPDGDGSKTENSPPGDGRK